jgi:hypothetical protein
MPLHSDLAMTQPRRLMTPEELLRSKVGANIKRSLRRLWAGDMEFDELCDAVQPTAEGVQRAIEALLEDRGVVVTVVVEEIVEEMRLDPDAVAALAEEMGLGPRVEPECHLPTPEEIRIATARFRAEWSPSERESRLQGPRFGRMD